MANKRMFTMKIVDSDAFLDMPLSTQCLYFHLNMRADDDGFIGNPKRVMKIIGSSDDDLKLLIAKKFVLCFDGGVIVIKHWRMHNTLSQNRYHETQYLEEKSMLRLKKNGSYSLSDGDEIDDKKLIDSKEKYEKTTKADKRLDNGLQTADSDKDLDLDSELDLDKDLDLDSDKELNIVSEEKENTNSIIPPISPFKGDGDSNKKRKNKNAEDEKHHYGEYNHVLLTDDQINRLYKDYGEERTNEAIKFLDEYIQMKGGYKANEHNLALRRWVFRAVDEEKQKNNRVYGNQNKTAEMLQKHYDMTAEWVREMEEKQNDIQ